MTTPPASTGVRIDPDDVTIAYVGGGSRQWAPTLVRDLALSDLDGRVRLFDVNGAAAARRNERFGNWVQERDAATADWEYAAVDDLQRALDGADVVVLSTQHDPTETFVHDLEIPKEYGIYGAVSATIGPGGIVRALRTLPEYRSIADAIRERCPDAWVVNYTNPVHFATRALYREYPGINALGLCHEVQGTRSHLARLAREHLDVAADPADVSVNVKGINHFTWVDEATCEGADLVALVDRLAETAAARREYTAEDLAGESPFVDNWQVTWELYRQFGLLPAAGDRHLVEYAPWFLQDGEAGLTRWGVKRTGSDYRAKHWTPADSEQTTDVEAWLSGEREFALERSDEVFVDLVAALAGDGPLVTNANLPNAGQVSDLPADAVVETNVRVTGGTVTPVVAGGFPRALRSLLRAHVDVIETVVAASDDGDLDAAYRGFLLDQQVRSLLPDEARDLFAELVAAEAPYLQDWDLDGAEVLAASGVATGSETKP